MPSPAGEAFWIALLDNSKAAAWDVALLSYGRKGNPVDVLTGLPATGPAARVALPPHQFIAGIRQGTGTWWAFAREPSPPAPATAVVDLFIRVWPSTGSPPARPATPTPQHMPGEEESREDRPTAFAAGRAAQEEALHVIFTDEVHFRMISGRQLDPLRNDSGLGDIRLP
ncbi:MAG: hypothetical protein ABWY04_02115 [Arthrobacter sp.]